MYGKRFWSLAVYFLSSDDLVDGVTIRTSSSSSIFVAGTEVDTAIASFSDKSYPSVCVVDDFLLLGDGVWIVWIYGDFE